MTHFLRGEAMVGTDDAGRAARRGQLLEDQRRGVVHDADHALAGNTVEQRGDMRILDQFAARSLRVQVFDTRGDKHLPQAGDQVVGMRQVALADDHRRQRCPGGEEFARRLRRQGTGPEHAAGHQRLDEVAPVHGRPTSSRLPPDWY